VVSGEASPAAEPGGLELRGFRDADADAIRDLHDVALMAAGVHLGPGRWDDDLDAISDVYLDAGGEFIVGHLDGRLVAMGALRHVNQTAGEIKRLRVHPRFQRRGFGRAVFGCLEQAAHQRGYRRLTLAIALLQIPAQRLFESAGFQEAGRGEISGVAVIYYAKRLD
jgi:ribosomal protein S18 acetylase RimI-like enzyme